jgi:hypothetical protein
MYVRALASKQRNNCSLCYCCSLFIPIYVHPEISRILLSRRSFLTNPTPYTHTSLIVRSLTLRHKEDFSMAINFLNSDTNKESFLKEQKGGT